MRGLWNSLIVEFKIYLNKTKSKPLIPLVEIVEVNGPERVAFFAADCMSAGVLKVPSLSKIGVIFAARVGTGFTGMLDS